MPRWQRIATIVLLVAIFAVVLVVARQQGTTNAAVKATNSSSARRDCVTSLSTARRSVFDNVDIYKAIQIEQLSTALLDAQSGIRATPDAIKAFAANDAELKESLVEARRLQPAQTLDDLIAHGGIIDGKRYEPCPQ